MGTIYTYPGENDFNNKITASKEAVEKVKEENERRLKEVKEENARRLKEGEDEVEKSRQEWRQASEPADIFDAEHGYAWPIERRECDDGSVALVIEVRNGAYCTCCNARLRLSQIGLQRLGVDKVIIRHPMQGSHSGTKLCDHYHLTQDSEGRDVLLYPDMYAKKHDCEVCEAREHEFYGKLPEIPGLLEWEFYDKEEQKK